jgi:hypothetical protein
MREYEHVYREGILVIADPTSAKGKHGLDCPEYLEPTDLHFLRKGHTIFPHSAVIYQLTEETKGVLGGPPFKELGGGFIIVEEQQYSGGFTEGGTHKSQIIWEE